MELDDEAGKCVNPLRMWRRRDDSDGRRDLRGSPVAVAATAAAAVTVVVIAAARCAPERVGVWPDAAAAADSDAHCCNMLLLRVLQRHWGVRMAG